jgi:ankyrin repeat protein
MPKTLDETYERALLEIDEGMRQYAQRLFQCLAVSIRPLRVEELAEIMAVQFDAGALPEFNPDWRLGDAEEAVLSVCSNLISVVDVDGSQVVQFSHFSVKEFLSSDRLAAAREDLSGYHIVPHLAHTILAQASLSVLLQLDDRIDKDSIRNFPLSGYAAQHWVDHGLFENVSSAIQVAMERLFDPDQPYFSAWVWIYDIDSPWRESMRTMRPKRPQAAPLYYAVLCGFPHLIKHLIATYPGDVDVKGGNCKSPLLAAFIKDDIYTASLLLRRGADANALDEHRVSPLHRASQGGRFDIVQLLLEHNADVDLRSTSGTTPLGWASRAGDIVVSRLLLQRGANANSQNAKGESPLHSASNSGHVKVVELLIQHGADADSRNKKDETPLHIAAFKGHLDTVKLLLGRGAGPNIHNNNDKTPLDLASGNGKLDVVNFLSQLTMPLGRTVEPTASSVDSQSQSRHPSVVKRPQPRREDVKHSEDEQPSMHTASKNGQIDVVRSSLGRGSDVDERNSARLTALALASRHGRLQVANLLIESGADVNSRGRDGWTPLHRASVRGHLDIVRLLLDHGADLNARQRDQWSALDLASIRGHLAITELLIERGADVSVRNGYGWTPKQGALARGDYKIAELLSRYHH